jgi:hypothetical protein
MMATRRFYAALSLVVLGVLAVAVLEATLFALVALISWILGQTLDVQLGPVTFVLQQGCCGPDVLVFNAATVGSFLFTGACGVGAAIARYRRWRPIA